ncbi:hypothetical protein DL769_006035 [Monosporascus sp. CRB-8-3]|nr:hypothetical protein DL769_006035 [Monosporascus sp. CRB-8-3]
MGCVVNGEDAARVRQYAERGEVKTMDMILAVLASRKNTTKQAIIGELASLDPYFKMAYHEAKRVVSSHVSVLEASRLLNSATRGNSIAMDFQATVLASRGKVTKQKIYFDMQVMNPEKKTILHAAAESGHNAAHVAARYGHLEFASLLVKRGAWLDLPNRWHMTKIHTATKYKQHRVMRYLIGRRVNIDKRMHSGETALHLAVRNDDTRGVRILLDAGMRTNTANMAGCSAFDIAVSENKLGALAALQGHRGFNPRTPVFRPFESEGSR